MLPPGSLAALGHRRDADFHATALRLAQWYISHDEYPKALLALNRACSVADVAAPFAEFDRILSHYAERAHYGNPVRHFQHLASRMNGPHRELRSWRAWGCFHLARKHLSPNNFPLDEEQIRTENLDIPSIDKVLDRLKNHQLPNDTLGLRKLF